MSSSLDTAEVYVNSEIDIANNELKRSLSWKDVFWVASGVPALVLFSMGAIAVQVGTPSCLVWTLSVIMGFFQAFTYAEIAGLFPNKSGGASVYGAIGWLRYSKLIAPLSTWCNWFAWTPVLSIGTGLIAGYILTSLLPADSALATWQFTLLDLGWIKDGLSFRLNSTFFLGAFLLICIFTAQHFGISKAAKITMVLALAGLLPLTIVSITPLLTGDVIKTNFIPFVPLSGSWDIAGVGIFFSGMFVAAWSTYCFETCVCYTSELKTPKTDCIKSIVVSGIMCIIMFSIVPFVFQGVFGSEGLSKPEILDGSGVAMALAQMINGGTFVTGLIIVMLILALALSVMTSMGGSSRTLYQASVDGWFPRYLSYVNKHGSPTNAMWTDLCFNLILLMMSDYMFVLMASNCGYIIFNFLNLNAGWIHRMDNGHINRPFKAPNWLIGFNVLLGFANMVFMGAAGAVIGKGTILSGLAWACLIIPVFWYRHYVQDKGQFPEKTLLELESDGSSSKNCGFLPYLTLIAGLLTVCISYEIFIQ